VSDDIRQSQIDYFDRHFNAHGVSVEGLNYGTKARQQLCFAQAARIITHAPGETFSLNDYGCGFADLIPFLAEHDRSPAHYTGYDITPSVLQAARDKFVGQDGIAFVDDEEALPLADYTVAIGVFNVKGERSVEDWRKYVTGKLDKLWTKTSGGLAFNILTKYSDADKMRPHLYYADPAFYFDYCKRNFSRNVALLHDYGVYEFTILVRPD
jgi:SAM-dependent methyltransferase